MDADHFRDATKKVELTEPRRQYDYERILDEAQGVEDTVEVLVPDLRALLQAARERDQLQTMKETLGGEACREERAMGNGPCGCCRQCVLDAESTLAQALLVVEEIEQAQMSQFPLACIHKILAAFRAKYPKP